MREVQTQKPSDDMEPCGPRDVIIFTNAFFGADPDSTMDFSPGFVAGGFMMPDWFGEALAIRDVFRFPSVAGHVESQGRNRYINGCSASLLIMPPEKGNPCLNHLHLTPGVIQDEHTHPSDRMGLVVRGSGGRACHPGGAIDLAVGTAWFLPAGEPHHFETGDEALDIVVFHPSSSWGPTHESHQMLDETIME